MLIALDPGLRDAGLAAFDKDGQLVAAQWVRCDNGEGPTQWRAMADALCAAVEQIGAPRVLCVELMQPNAKRPATLPRILQLAYTTGAFIGQYGEDVEVCAVDPHLWTAGLDKKRNHPRILARLSPAEQAVLGAALAKTMATKHKEVIDAVGIGLYVLRRL